MHSTGTSRRQSTTSLKPSAALRSSLRARGKRPGSITYFYSPKNSRDLVFSTEIEFCCGLMLEGDERVKSYEIDSIFIKDHLFNNAYLGKSPSFIIFHHDGSIEYREVKYSEDENSNKWQNEFVFADAVGVKWGTFSNRQVNSNLRFIHDWLLICPIITQSRYSIAALWESLSLKILMHLKESITLNDLKNKNIDSWDNVFSVVFKLVQLGVVVSDLSINPLSPKTELKISGACYGR